ncbi:voltage-gated potassium channel [Alteribacillus persepolensis]|uniref:Voltage-gated potassium channel n=1 Tax=Alteribacillus persepolensis TaxID=568899 RepID=A0A1G8ASD8_9BACI|nr:potassium channel family protein [Alteribacillus persepolensis]SDH23982.1 voltage-gated potassium channel [Alteribacillus persepolensis]
MIIFQRLLYKLISVSNRFLLLTSLLLVVTSSLLVYVIEPNTFEHPVNGFWWVMTTVTTVGYGDYYPVTLAGKALAVVLYIFGIGLISIVITKIVDQIFLFQRRKEQGKLDYNGSNHFVIIDWSTNARLAIQEILHSDPEAEVVIIDQLEKTPWSHERVHYVQGSPVEKSVLEQANLKEAKAVFIFANEITEFGKVIQDASFVDGKTLLIATTIERHYRDIYTIVEIKDRQNVDNFTHVDVDEFILSTDTVSQMAVRAAFHPGSSRIMSQLLSKQHGDDLYEIRRRPHWNTYRDAFQELLREGATLVSDGDQLNINKKLDEPLSEKARLFVICDAETYQKINAPS